MGDMREDFDALKECLKMKKEERNNFFEPLLKEAGAIYKADGIYEYNGWFCYPTKGFAMLKKNNKIRTSLKKLLQRVSK